MQLDYYIRPYSLNTTTAYLCADTTHNHILYNFVTEWSDIAVFIRLRVCMSQHIAFYLPLASLGISVLLCSSVAPCVTGKRTMVFRCLYLCGSASNTVAKRSVASVFTNLRCADRVCLYYGLRVSLQIKLNSSIGLITVKCLFLIFFEK